MAALRRPELSEALGENYAATFSRLKGLFRSRGVPDDEAADLAQETAARLLVFIERHGGIVDDPYPLIHRIATNLLIDRARSSERRVVQLDPVAHDRPTALSLDEEVTRRQRRQVLRREIRELSGRQRDAIVLSLDGHSPSEIADHMGLERNAADALLFRARKTLAGRLTAVKEELSGFGAIAMIRLRTIAKRGNETPSPGQFAAAVPAFVHVFSAVIAIAIGGMGSAPAFGVATMRVPAIVSAVPAAGASTIGRVSTGQTETAATPKRLAVDARNHEVHLHSKVKGPGQSSIPVSVDIWQERDDVHRGVAGPAFDSATDRTCSARRLNYVCAPGA